jgi:hypothetical protein
MPSKVGGSHACCQRTAHCRWGYKCLVPCTTDGPSQHELQLRSCSKCQHLPAGAMLGEESGLLHSSEVVEYDGLVMLAAVLSVQLCDIAGDRGKIVLHKPVAFIDKSSFASSGRLTKTGEAYPSQQQVVARSATSKLSESGDGRRRDTITSGAALPNTTFAGSRVSNCAENSKNTPPLEFESS